MHASLAWLPLASFDFGLVVDHTAMLLLSLVLAIPVALERENQQLAASPGLRTYPLVAVACCGFTLIGLSSFGGDAGAESRVLYGLMTGMGFIGGGAILKDKDGTLGTASAASLWATGAMGAAVGFRRYEIAVALSVLTLANLVVGVHVKRRMGKPADKD